MLSYPSIGSSHHHSECPLSLLDRMRGDQFRNIICISARYDSSDIFGVVADYSIRGSKGPDQG